MNTHEGLVLMRQLREELLSDIFFTQALLNMPSEDLEAVRRIIKTCRHLRSNRQPENERAAHQHIKDVDRAVSGKKKPKLRQEARQVIRKMHRVSTERVLAVHGEHLSRVRRQRASNTSITAPAKEATHETDGYRTDPATVSAADPSAEQAPDSNSGRNGESHTRS